VGRGVDGTETCEGKDVPPVSLFKLGKK
jgi:hypothetical protein